MFQYLQGCVQEHLLFYSTLQRGDKYSRSAFSFWGRHATKKHFTPNIVSVFFICIINKLVILQDHMSQPHTGYDKTYF